MPPKLQAKMFVTLKIFRSNPYMFFEPNSARKELCKGECTFFLRFVNFLNHVLL